MVNVPSLVHLTRSVIAPEANHLLTEFPGQSGVPGDFGWFCREHVIVATAVFKALGYPLEIQSGDVTVLAPRLHLTTTKTHGDLHYWCSAPSFRILDLSLTLCCMPGGPFLLGPVLEEGQNGDFMIALTDDIERHSAPHFMPSILYTPHAALVPLQMEKSAAFIASAISIHILKLIRQETHSYRNIPQDDALSKIADAYPDAMQTVQKIITSA